MTIADNKKKPAPAKDKKIRAIALAGGGPLVGIQVGAMKVLEEQGMDDFAVWSCGCVGSWTGCLYNGYRGELAGTKKWERLYAFFRQIFVPDDIYASFPVATGAFIPDYLGDMEKMIAKLGDPATYHALFLPERIAEWWWQSWVAPPASRDQANLWLSKGMALNPWCRLGMELSWNLPKSGIAGLVRDTSFIDQFIDFGKILRSDKAVYLNTFNFEQREIELFANRDPYRKISAPALMAGSSVLFFTENHVMGGVEYCEGAVIDTVNFRDLLKNHGHELDEIWVIRITDRREIRPPKTLIDSQLLGVMLPFTTIAEDDVKLFQQHLAEEKRQGRVNPDLDVIEIRIPHSEVNYHWSYANLDQGVDAGERGARAALARYRKKHGA